MTKSEKAKHPENIPATEREGEELNDAAYTNELLAARGDADDKAKASLELNSPVGSNAAYRDGKDTK
jgi:hypothetical protein